MNRRIDTEGRDVTDLPGLWCESDRWLPVAKPDCLTEGEWTAIQLFTDFHGNSEIPQRALVAAGLRKLTWAARQAEHDTREKSAIYALHDACVKERDRLRVLPRRTAAAVVDSETHLQAAWNMFGQIVGDETFKNCVEPFLDNLVYRVAHECENAMHFVEPDGACRWCQQTSCYCCPECGHDVRDEHAEDCNALALERGNGPEAFDAQCRKEQGRD